MTYAQLGRSAMHISRIGFGCMSLTASTMENTRLLQEAADRGINFFDTADLYGKGANEELVGAALKQRRKNIFLATKVGNQWKEDGSGWTWNPNRSYILESVEKSLKRLGTDYIDLYQLHGGTIDDPLEETIGTFNQLVQEGKIRYYGISSIRPNVIREWVSRSAMVSVMMQYSLLDRRPEETCLPLLEKAGIGVLVRGSLAQGLLAGKLSKNYLQYAEADVQKASALVRSHSPVGNPGQAALQFVLQQPGITAAVVGIRTATQLDEALKAAEAKPLSTEIITELQTLLAPNLYAEHR